jgi:hypothetical protein
MLLALVAAVAGVPLAADLCAADCTAAHGSASSPPCHHAARAAASIEAAPAPCGHDHHLSKATTTGVARAPIDASADLPADFVVPRALAPRLSPAAAVPHGPPLLHAAHTLALRI